MESVSRVAIRCSEQFSNLKALEGSEALQDDIAKASIDESHGRFRVWCGNLGACKTDRSSLEFRLREAARTKALVLSLLSDLENLLSKGRFRFHILVHTRDLPLVVT